MTDFRIATEIDRAKITSAGFDKLLGDPTIAALEKSGSPVIVTRNDPFQIIWSNPAGLSLFAASDTEALTQRMLHSQDDGMLSLIRLAGSLPEGTAPRLERLRLRIGEEYEVITFLCQRMKLADGIFYFVAAGLGVRQALTAQPPAMPPLTVKCEEESTSTLSEPDSIQNLSSETETVPALLRRFGQAKSARLVWQTDSNGLLCLASPALADLTGIDEKQLTGRDFADLAASQSADPEHQLVEAFSKRSSWGGLDLSWPLPDAPLQVPITLGGLPVIDSKGSFAGYRGFGIVHLDRLAPYQRPEPVPSDIVSSEIAEPESETAKDSAQTSPGAPIQHKPATPITMGAGPDILNGAAARNVVPLRPMQPIHKILHLEPISGPTPSQPVQEAKLASEQDESPTNSEAGQNDTLGQEIASPDEPAHEEQQDTYGPPNPAMLRQSYSRQPVELSGQDRNTFREIARALGVRVRDENDTPSGADPDSSVDLADTPDRMIATVPTPGMEMPVNVVAITQPVSETRIEEPLEMPERLVRKIVSQAAPKAVASDMAAQLDDGFATNGRMMVDRVPVGILVSRSNVPIFANQTLLDLLDYPNIDAFHESGGMAHMFGNSDQTATAGMSDGRSVPILTRSGGTIPVDARIQTIAWDGLPASLLTIRRPVEESLAKTLTRLEAEVKAGKQAMREWRAIFDTAHDAKVVMNSKGIISQINRAAEKMFGYSGSDIRGEPFDCLIAEDARPIAHDYLATMIKAASDQLDTEEADGIQVAGFDTSDSRLSGRDIVGRQRKGEEIPLYMTIGRISNGDDPKFCAVMRDMAPWKKAEQEINTARREAEKASAHKSEFLARISHEIRTPLNAILGFAEVISEERFGPVGNPRYKDYLKDIHASGTHVMSLVNDLLDLSKIEAGRMELAFVAVDANRIIAECVSLMQPQASHERVIMRQSLATSLPKIMADERSIRQIVLNLLSNAVKFNEPGGQIIVSTALTDQNEVVIRVRDTGIGMSESEIGIALEPFRQIATARPRSGTGLGLPLTKALVEANRAAMSIRSRKDEGTLIEIIFPSSRVVMQAGPSPAPANARLG